MLTNANVEDLHSTDYNTTSCSTPLRVLPPFCWIVMIKQCQKWVLNSNMVIDNGINNGNKINWGEKLQQSTFVEIKLLRDLWLLLTWDVIAITTTTTITKLNFLFCCCWLICIPRTYDWDNPTLGSLVYFIQRGKIYCLDDGGYNCLQKSRDKASTKTHYFTTLNFFEKALISAWN